MQLHLTFTERPTNEEIEGESELTNKLCNNWDALEVHNDLVYRKFVCKRSGEPFVLQLLVPRCQVAEVLRQCHTGTVNGLLIKCSDVSIGQRRKATPYDTAAIVGNVPRIIEESYVVRDL